MATWKVGCPGCGGQGCARCDGSGRINADDLTDDERDRDYGHIRESWHTRTMDEAELNDPQGPA